MSLQIIIDEIVSQLRVMDGDSALSRAQMQRIVTAVLAAVDEREGHRGRVAAEQRLASVRDDLEGRVG